MQEDADSAPTLLDLIPRVVAGEALSAEEVETAFITVMEGRATPVQIAALLVGLRAHGENPIHVAAGVRALRRAMIPVPTPEGWAVVDTCGTGGGSFTTFNISTAAALLAAGAGVPIAKHGNRSFTSKCGSADVLAALGIPIELKPEQMADVLAQAGIVFMFAPLLHPAMRHVAPVRRELGMPTIMNLLGPITNPAHAQRQVIGVSHPRLLELIAGALLQLGHHHALVVHGDPGMDELSPIGETDVIEIAQGKQARYRIKPQDFFPEHDRFDPADLAGGDPEFNANVILDILHGKKKGAAAAAVALNAGAAIYIAGLESSLSEGVARAVQALEQGKGVAALERLRTATARAIAGASEPAG